MFTLGSQELLYFYVFKFKIKNILKKVFMLVRQELFLTILIHEKIM